MENQEIIEKIEQETQLIKQLESSCPTFHTDVHKWDVSNTPFHQHQTKIVDAYWRRRMLKSKLQNCKECVIK